MALDTYAHLQTYILGRINRSLDTDAATAVIDWIALAEDELRLAARRLQLRQGETVNAAFTISAEYTALPSGFYRQRSLLLTGAPNVELDFVPPNVSDRWGLNANADKPVAYTVQGNQIRVTPPPDTSYAGIFTYFGLPSLSNSNTTNWLLTAHPKIYVAATLAEAYAYYGNDTKQAKAESDRERLLFAAYESDGSDQMGSNQRMQSDGGCP
jgi:hypothetical protein